MFLYEGMVLVIFRKVKSRFFLIKKYSTTKSLVLGIVVWIILSSRRWWGSYSPGFSSRTTLAVSGRKFFAVACPTSRSKCKSVQQRELTLLFDFYLGYTRGAGRTCGEEVETTWSSTNALAPSVREMAPGARHDTLNDHWNGWNFRKIVRFRMYHTIIFSITKNSYYLIGTLFSKRFQEAVLMSAKHTEIFEKFSATFPPETVGKWVRMVEHWENDPKAPNPYDESEQSKCLSQNIFNY